MAVRSWISLVFLFSLCFSTSAFSQVLEIPGTGANQLLLRELGHVFEKKNPQFKIIVPDTIGTRGGIRALISGKNVVARISRPLRKNEIEAGINAIFFAVSPVVFITHPSVSHIDNLNQEDVLSIYSGQQRNWEAFNGPSRKIYPVTRDSGSVLGAVRNAVKDFPNAKMPLAKPVPSIIDMVKTVEGHPFTVGFSTLNLATSHQVTILKFNQVEPTEQAIVSGHYPISVKFGLAMVENNDPVLKQFINFLYSDEAQAIMMKFNVLPLPRHQ